MVRASKKTFFMYKGKKIKIYAWHGNDIAKSLMKAKDEFTNGKRAISVESEYGRRKNRNETMKLA